AARPVTPEQGERACIPSPGPHLPTCVIRLALSAHGPAVVAGPRVRSNNVTHQPLIAALELLKRYANSSQRLYPAREDVPLAGVVPPATEELVVHTGAKGHQRVDRVNYEICVLR